MAYLEIAQIVLASALIIVVLLQSRGSGLGSAFGGSNTVFSVKRGLEKKLYNATIVISILFFAVSLAVIIL
ncbi:preprotein translocase subunit SecG [bacterium]|nr:preprotein translocase subunit SecG [bacterium]